MRLRDAILAAALATLIAGAIGAQQPWTDDPAVAGATPIKAVHLEEIHWRIGAPRQDRGVPRAIDTDPPRSDNAIQASHFVIWCERLYRVIRAEHSHRCAPRVRVDLERRRAYLMRSMRSL